MSQFGTDFIRQAIMSYNLQVDPEAEPWNQVRAGIYVKDDRYIIRVHHHERLKGRNNNGNYAATEPNAPADLCWLYGQYMDDNLHDVDVMRPIYSFKAS